MGGALVFARAARDWGGGGGGYEWDEVSSARGWDPYANLHRHAEMKPKLTWPTVFVWQNNQNLTPLAIWEL